ncbi:TetR/AcrR family transcriptional regulator C-terminal domain-containing protein [Amycolatopsis sp. CA-230715]|uniref:TetR/AcrR family transcriptional regulator C-terminal domain-containing protein n=1 Tax=Amycolatopsis sp. CA-230715 TaxID=2745196 RepID=UPI001C00C48E|nr:TetR/AcrR family transcriptional regulator C-terminal domain-containing protein [Amycolatopsis sp. CA-230715]
MVLDAALRLGDEKGLEAVSMRGVAKELGVEAMSLYNHVSNKAAMITGMLERVLAGIEIPDAGLEWGARLRALATAMHSAFTAHPVAATMIVTGAAPRGFAALRPIEELYAILYGAGFSDEIASRGVTAVTGLVFGTAMLAPARGQDAEERTWFRQNVTAERFPNLHRALRAETPDAAADFGHQVDLVVEGLRARQ